MRAARLALLFSCCTLAACSSDSTCPERLETIGFNESPGRGAYHHRILLDIAPKDSKSVEFNGYPFSRSEMVDKLELARDIAPSPVILLAISPDKSCDAHISIARVIDDTFDCQEHTCDYVLPD